MPQYAAERHHGQITVFSAIPCEGEEKRELDGWLAFQRRHLSLIGERKLFGYLAFFFTHRRYFEELAYFSTFEQYAIRLMMDLCAILKR